MTAAGRAFVYLASRSPRRHLLLEQLGIRFAILDIEIDESRRRDESAESLVSRLAQEKAKRGWSAVQDDAPAPVIGADTMVECDGCIMGKPRDRADARAMIARLSGRRHRVLSAVALQSAGSSGVRMTASEVFFRALSGDEQRAYCATDEPLDKAGGYGVQGVAGAFISRLEGSYSGVMGLPLCETAELLREVGIDVLRVES